MPYFNSNGNKLYYRIEGSGPPIILIPGLATNHRGWGLQFIELKKSFTLQSIDNRGFGKSDRTIEKFSIKDLALDIGNLLKATGFEKVHLIGSSMGALIALEYALENPENVTSLVLASVPIHESLDRFEKFYKDLRFALEKYTEEAFSQKLASYIFSTNFLSDEMFNVLNGFAGKSTVEYRPKAILSQLQAIAKWLELRKWERGCKKPCLFIFGSNDRLVPHGGSSNYLCRFFENAKTVVIQNAGHAMHIENPHEFNKTVFKFLDSIEHS